MWEIRFAHIETESGGVVPNKVIAEVGYKLTRELHGTVSLNSICKYLVF